MGETDKLTAVEWPPSEHLGSGVIEQPLSERLGPGMVGQPPSERLGPGVVPSGFGFGSVRNVLEIVRISRNMFEVLLNSSLTRKLYVFYGFLIDTACL